MTADGTAEAQKLVFTSNMGDKVLASQDHPLSFVEETDSKLGSTYIPYLEVRDGLKARISRNVYYQLMDLLVEGEGDDRGWLGIWSAGVFFAISESTLD